MSGRQRVADRSRSADRGWRNVHLDEMPSAVGRASSITRHSIGPPPPGGLGTGSLYGFKAALAVIVIYFGVKLLVQFEEILLPFIMALLVVSVLEPIKQLTLEVLECSLLLVFEMIPGFSCCFASRKRANAASQRRPFVDAVNLSPDGSPSRRVELHDVVKRVLLIVSMLVTCVIAGRCSFIVARLVWLSGEAVIHDFAFYQMGVEKRGAQVQVLLKQFHLEKQAHMDMEDICNLALDTLKSSAEFVTQQAIYTLTQACLTIIFVIFLLYSPVQRNFSPVTKGVFESMEVYLKLKTLISAMMGITNGVALYFIGLELPAAWGLMTFLANFIPNIGGPVMSILPCVIAALDIRKSLYQVCTAFAAQFFLHFTMGNFVEPVIFGNTKDIHSVLVMLGLSFFGYIWGFTGMFLSVPLLFAMHAWLDVTTRNPKASAEAKQDAHVVMKILEGHWLGEIIHTEATELDGEGASPDEQEMEQQASGSTVPATSAFLPEVGSEASFPHLDTPPSLVDSTESLPTRAECGFTDQLRSNAIAFSSAARGKFPVLEWDGTLKFQAAMASRDPKTRQVRLQGVLLRWLVLIVFILVIFFGDLHALIHPSSDDFDPAAFGNTTLVGNTTLRPARLAPSVPSRLASSTTAAPLALTSSAAWVEKALTTPAPSVSLAAARATGAAAAGATEGEAKALLRARANAEADANAEAIAEADANVEAIAEAEAIADANAEALAGKGSSPAAAPPDNERPLGDAGAGAGRPPPPRPRESASSPRHRQDADGRVAASSREEAGHKAPDAPVEA